MCGTPFLAALMPYHGSFLVKSDIINLEGVLQRKGKIFSPKRR